MGITVPDTVKAGTYSLSSIGDYTAQYNPNSSTFLGAVSGSLTITEHDPVGKTIKGTFNFEAEELTNPANKASITEGVFNVTY